MLAPRTPSIHHFERAENYVKSDDELCVLSPDDPMSESFESHLENDVSGSISSVSNGDGRHEDIIDEKMSGKNIYASKIIRMFDISNIL